MNDTWRDLLVSSLTGEDKSDLAYERQQALLEQKNNRDQLRKNLSSYRAKVSAQGISPLSGSALSVQKGMIEKTQDVYVKALGWVRDGVTPLWKIKSDVPEPCQVVCVTTTMKVSG